MTEKNPIEEPEDGRAGSVGGASDQEQAPFTSPAFMWSVILGAVMLILVLAYLLR